MRRDESPAVLWLLDPSTVSTADVERHIRLLTPAEIGRAQSYATTALRHDHLCTRIMQRRVLSAITGIDPADWRFGAEPGGRPVVDEPAIHRDLGFSISHTAGLIAVMGSRDTTVGIDVEALDMAVDVRAVASRFFSPEESAALRTLEGDDRQLLFFRLWTLKEAASKALGTGIAEALDAARFDISEAGIVTARIAAAPTFKGEWSFETLRPTARHVAGVAILAPAGRTTSRSIENEWFDIEGLRP